MVKKIKCEACGESFDESVINRHFRKHKLTIKEYYKQYHPRNDRLTHEPIVFKNREQYLSSEFNSKLNLIEWFKTAPEEAAKDYIMRFLTNRKESKNLIYTPTQVELRSLLCPSIITIEKYFKSYYKLCESLGFKSRFINPENITANIPENPLIIVDTREQNPLIFDNSYIKRKGLKYGDYAIEPSPSNFKTVIERKSLPDFIATFSEQIERFKREFKRCKEDGAYMIVIVEDKLANALDFKNKCDVSPRLKITPEYVFRNVRDLLQKEDKIQFLFVKSHEEAAMFTERILHDGVLNLVSDLQFLYDKKSL